MKGVASACETSLNVYHTSRRNIPEDSKFQNENWLV
jgi:hypothetical protein